MENTEKKPAGTGEVLEILVVQKGQTEKKKLNSVVNSGFDDQLEQKLPSICSGPWMEVDDVSRSWVENCRSPPYFHNSTSDDKYDQVPSFLQSFLVTKKTSSECVFLKRDHDISARYDLDVRDRSCNG